MMDETDGSDIDSMGDDEGTEIVAEEHHNLPPASAGRRSTVCSFISYIATYLYSLFFSFTPPSHGRPLRDDNDVERNNRYNRRSNREYTLKLLALKSLNVPDIVSDEYRKNNDPAVTDKIDRTVADLHRTDATSKAFQQSMNISYITDLQRNYLETRLKDSRDMRNQFLCSLLTQTLTLPNEHLADATRDSIKSAGESEARGDWLNASKKIMETHLKLHDTRKHVSLSDFSTNRRQLCSETGSPDADQQQVDSTKGDDRAGLLQQEHTLEMSH